MTETLGQRIIRLRTERGMSQGDLADTLDISRQSVSKWENDIYYYNRNRGFCHCAFLFLVFSVCQR